MDVNIILEFDLINEGFFKLSWVYKIILKSEQNNGDILIFIKFQMFILKSHNGDFFNLS